MNLTDTRSTGSPIDRLARLYALRQRLELEITAAEALLDNQENARKRLQIAYSADRRRRRKVAVCGTDSGYHKHLRRLKEPACEPCRLAHAEAERSRARRAKEAS